MKTVDSGQWTVDSAKKTLSLSHKLSIIFFQSIAAIGFMLIGCVLTLFFLFTEQEFWANVERFWR